MQTASSVPKILAFHKLTPHITYGVTNYTPKRFDSILQHLISLGYEPCPLEQLLGENRNWRNRFAITFDDGYQHLCTHLPPLIEKYRIAPTIFMPTYYIGKRNSWDYSSYIKNDFHLDKADILFLASLGVGFGTHGHRHIDLTSCTQKICKRELLQSQIILEDILGKPVTTVSYPFGKYNETVLDMVQKTGYTYGFTMHFPARSNRNETIGRFAVYGYDTKLSIVQKLSHGPLYPLEKLKAAITNRLSGGTILLNRFRGSTDT